MAEHCYKEKLPFVPVSSATGYNIQKPILKALQIGKYFNTYFELPQKNITFIGETLKIGFNGSANDIELLQSCFYDVGGRFVQEVSG